MRPLLALFIALLLLAACGDTPPVGTPALTVATPAAPIGVATPGRLPPGWTVVYLPSTPVMWKASGIATSTGPVLHLDYTKKPEQTTIALNAQAIGNGNVTLSYGGSQSTVHVASKNWAPLTVTTTVGIGTRLTVTATVGVGGASQPLPLDVSLSADPGQPIEMRDPEITAGQ